MLPPMRVTAVTMYTNNNKNNTNNNNKVMSPYHRQYPALLEQYVSIVTTWGHSNKYTGIIINNSK